jgi:hypothetical protein
MQCSTGLLQRSEYDLRPSKTPNTLPNSVNATKPKSKWAFHTTVLLFYILLPLPYYYHPITIIKLCISLKSVNIHHFRTLKCVALMLFTPLNLARSCRALQIRSLDVLQWQNTIIMSEPFCVQNTQCKYNVTLTSVRATTVAVEK